MEWFPRKYKQVNVDHIIRTIEEYIDTRIEEYLKDYIRDPVSPVNMIKHYFNYLYSKTHRGVADINHGLLLIDNQYEAESISIDVDVENIYVHQITYFNDRVAKSFRIDSYSPISHSAKFINPKYILIMFNFTDYFMYNNDINTYEVFLVKNLFKITYHGSNTVKAGYDALGIYADLYPEYDIQVRLRGWFPYGDVLFTPKPEVADKILYIEVSKSSEDYGAFDRGVCISALDDTDDVNAMVIKTDCFHTQPAYMYLPSGTKSILMFSTQLTTIREASPYYMPTPIVLINPYLTPSRVIELPPPS